MDAKKEKAAKIALKWHINDDDDGFAIASLKRLSFSRK